LISQILVQTSNFKESNAKYPATGLTVPVRVQAQRWQLYLAVLMADGDR
jgi:hypothetical protein